MMTKREQTNSPYNILYLATNFQLQRLSPEWTFKLPFQAGKSNSVLWLYFYSVQFQFL